VEKSAVCAEIHSASPISPFLIKYQLYFTPWTLWLQWSIFEVVDGRFLTDITGGISKTGYCFCILHEL
jgi:hypothetical protein